VLSQGKQFRLYQLAHLVLALPTKHSIDCGFKVDLVENTQEAKNP